jgi:subtilisin family serine protease
MDTTQAAGAQGHGGYTGRTLVLFAEDDPAAALTELWNIAGLQAEGVRDLSPDQPVGGNLFFEELGVAVLESSDPEQSARLASAASSRRTILASEPERIVYALGVASPQGILPAPSNGHRAPQPPPAAPGLLPPPSLAGREAEAAGTLAAFGEFMRGYREAVCHIEALVSALRDGASPPTSQRLGSTARSDVTWGLALTGVADSRYSGRGIRVAVLDTGFAQGHPDFAGRAVTAKSFVDGETADDGHGHGTHCIGTACGPRAPTGGVPRYGIAYEAEVFAGKVLSNAGSGADGGILAGINWAVRQRADVISMSLGSRVAPGATYSAVYEATARRAAAKGSLIVAAAGNDSTRPGYIAPVGHPANCPSIVAVAALDAQLQVAPFSNGGLTAGGGEINIAAPGVDVLSSWPMPTRYRSLQGTSMAAPHVAGIAALYAEATGLRGFALANALLSPARRLTPPRDFGWGLVQSC